MIPIQHARGRCLLYLGVGMLDCLVSGEDGGSLEGRRGVLLCDERLTASYGAEIRRLLGEASIFFQDVICTASELKKNQDALEACYEALERGEVGRDGFLLSVGGGIISDIGGFAAATWLRGIDHLIVPTTLLSMVDASVGGKCGVNRVLENGMLCKNMLGAFHPPTRIVTDLSTLTTLEPRCLRAGFSEVIKHAVIGDRSMLVLLEKVDLNTFIKEPALFEPIVERAIQIKKKLVEEDEREQGVRAFLNLGHTFAHALEASLPDTIMHGEAVGMGLLAACAVSEKTDRLGKALGTQIEELLLRLGLPIRVEHPVEVAALTAAMKQDKKRRRGVFRLVLPTETGIQLVDVDEAIASIGWDRILPV